MDGHQRVSLLPVWTALSFFAALFLTIYLPPVAYPYLEPLIIHITVVTYGEGAVTLALQSAYALSFPLTWILAHSFGKYVTLNYLMKQSY